VTHDRFPATPVVVTSAASGIGARTAELLAEQGARVVCADSDGPRVERVADDIRRQGGTALAHAVDVTSSEELEALAARCVAAFGSIGGLVTSAGISGYGTAAELDQATWDRVLAVNLTGTWLSVRAVLPAMLEAGGGAIVTLGSIAGLVGTPLATCYAASKAGVIGLTRQLAVDYGPLGIRANVVCPGTVPTPLVARGLRIKGALDDDDVRAELEQRARRFPLRRLGTVDDVAHLITYLLSGEAAWTTGAVHPVDGGLTAAGWT